MSRTCYFSNKSKQKGHSVSHSNRKTIRHWKPNLRKVRIKENGKEKNVKVSMKWYKKLKRGEVKGVELVHPKQFKKDNEDSKE